VILKVGAHARQIDDDPDSLSLKILCRADARELEDLRGLDGSRAKNHLATGAGCMQAARMQILDSYRTLPLDEDPRDVSADDQAQIRPRLRQI
jgi:hypothetical protein